MYYANYYLRTISFNSLNKPMCVMWELKNQFSFPYILTKKCLKNKTKHQTKQKTFYILWLPVIYSKWDLNSRLWRAAI